MKTGMSPWPSATSLSSSTPARDQTLAAPAGHVRNVQAELEQAAMRTDLAYQPFSPLIQAGGAAQGRAAGCEDTGRTGEPAANTPRQVHNDGGQSAVADRAADTGLRLRQSIDSPRRSPRNSRFSPPRAGEQGGQVGAWIANLSELLTSSLTVTIKEAASALEKALKTREGREALLARQHGVTRLMACLNNEDDDEEERKSVVRCGSRALAALSMDSRGRRGIIHVIGASSGSLVRMSQLLRCNDVETAQCMSLIVGNLVRAPWGPFAIHTHTHTHTHTRVCVCVLGCASRGPFAIVLATHGPHHPICHSHPETLWPLPSRCGCFSECTWWLAPIARAGASMCSNWPLEMMMSGCVTFNLCPNACAHLGMRHHCRFSKGPDGTWFCRAQT